MDPKTTLHFAEPTHPERDLSVYCHNANQIQGRNVREFESAIADRMGIPSAQVVVMNSCTAALHALAAYQLANWASKMTLFAPRLTWPSSYSWTGLLQECKRVFVDVDPHTGLVSPKEFRGVEGVGGLMLFVELWGNWRASLIESSPCPFIVDAAHNFAHFTHASLLRNPRCRGIAYSFYATKQLSCIRGGAAILPPGQSRYWYEAFRDSGTVGRNVRLGFGLNYEMPDVLAQIGLADLKSGRYDLLQNKRIALFTEYHDQLMDRAIHVIGGCSGHCCVVQFGSRTDRDRVRLALSDAGVATGIHYPVHEWFDKDQDWQDWKLSTRILTVPLHHKMRLADVKKVCKIMKEYT